MENQALEIATHPRVRKIIWGLLVGTLITLTGEPAAACGLFADGTCVVYV